MSAIAALCADGASCADPMIIGLAGEKLEKQGWLEVMSGGEEARRYLAEHAEVERVWVVSCDDVEPINLAASLKEDRPSLFVSLVDSDACGSVLSRAHNAGVDEVVGLTSFVREYGEAKGRFAAMGKHANLSSNTYAQNEGASPQASPYSVAPENEKRSMEAPRTEPVRNDRSPLERMGLARAVSKASPGPESFSTEPIVARDRAGASYQMGFAADGALAVKPAFLLPVVGGSGGVGKSAVSVVAAYAAHRRGYKTLLLDYDLQFGDMAHLSGAENPIAIDEAFAHPELVSRERQRTNGPVVISAPAHLESSELIAEAFPACYPAISEGFDVVVANTGAAWAEQHAALLERSSAALFLVDQRASSVRTCKRALDLCARCGIATGPFRFAINRCAKNTPFTSMDVSCALKGAPVFELKDGGRDVEELLGIGAPNQLLDSRNDFCVSLVQLLVKLLPDNAASADALAGEGAGTTDGRRGHRGVRRWGKGRS